MVIMTVNTTQLAAKLEQAFAAGGFAELGVDDLRATTGVSLRTLYKYFPSREAMVLAALTHRHERYVAYLFEHLPDGGKPALETIFDRMGQWMRENAPRGCLFHSAVAAYPHNASLLDMLEQHKAEIADRIASATGLTAFRDDLLLLHEGVTQSWSLLGDQAVNRAKFLGQLLGRQSSD